MGQHERDSYRFRSSLKNELLQFSRFDKAKCLYSVSNKKFNLVLSILSNESLPRASNYIIIQFLKFLFIFILSGIINKYFEIQASTLH